MFERLEAYVRKVMERWRIGWYRATVSSTGPTHRRVSIDPDWCETTLRRALRISSPILDVTPAVGTRVAVASQDGVPEVPAVLGQLWDDKAAPGNMSVWLRADLALHEGHAEIGATKSLHLVVGANPVDITPLDDGSIKIEASGAWIRITPTGKISIGNGAAELVSTLHGLVTTLQSAMIPTALGPQPFNLAPQATGLATAATNLSAMKA